MTTTAFATLAPHLTVNEPGNGTLEIWQLDTAEESLKKLFTDIFTNWWKEIQYGLLIQGGVLEFEPPCAPTKLGFLDGYLTVEFGHYGHMHLCVGLNKGYHCSPTAPEVAAIRKPSRVELYRKLSAKGEPTFWALRCFNSRLPEPEQTLTIYLPNPLLTHDLNYADPPDWQKLRLWNHIRCTYLGIDLPDPRDMLATKFTHD